METYTFDPNRKKEEKEERPKVESIVTTKATDKDGGKFLNKFISLFISDDIKDIKGYLLKDVVVPTIKNTIGDIVSMTFGINRSSNNYGSRIPVERVSYSNYYGSDSIRRRYNEPEERPEQRELAYTNRGDAEAVLMALKDIVERYGAARVNDLYDLSNRGDLCSLAGTKYGWKDLHSAKIVQNGRDYIIRMPKAFVLE